jgi:hypothetical protein
MRKLALKIEDLSVETFQAGPKAPVRGTVVGAGSYSAIGTCPHPCLPTYLCDTSHAECLQTFEIENTGICC